MFGIEVVTAMSKENAVFWEVAPFILVKVY
jgi:hypothetical protein